MTRRSEHGSGVEVARSPSRYYALAALATMVTCAIVVALHHKSFRTLISAHGLLHSAIAQRFAGAWLPFARPENPFFAGEPLPYYWFYHYVAARLAAVAGVHPLLTFEVMGLLALGIVWFAGAALGRRLGWGPGPAMAIGFLALAGTNALGSLFLLVKLAAGRPWPADDGAYLWGLTHPVMGMIRWNDPGALYGPLINFFLNTSSRPLGLALILVSLLVLFRYLESGRVGTLAALVLAFAACTAFSPIIGLLGGLALAGALVCDWAWDRFVGGRGGRPAAPAGAASARSIRPLLAAVALLAGCAVPAPTYYHLFARTTQPGIVLALRPDVLATVCISAGPLLVLALVAWLRLPLHRRFMGVVTLAGVVLLLGNAVVQLPSGNDSNLFHIAAFMLAAPAAGAFCVIGDWTPSRRRAGGGVLLLLLSATPAIVLWAYWARPAVPLALDGVRLRRAPAEASLSRVYEWIRASTPPDAVFVVDDHVLQAAVLGNVPDFPAVTDRRLFVSTEPDYMVDLYPDTGRRRRMSAALLSGQALTPDDRTYLTALGRPLLVIVEEATGAALERMQAAYGAPAHREDAIAVFRVIG